MLKFFVPVPFKDVRLLPMLAPPVEGDNRLFQHLPFEEYQGLFEQVDTSEVADAFLLPHNLTDLRHNVGYVEETLAAAKRAGKRVILFASQDDPSPLPYAEAIILRPSVYKSSLGSNEIVIPGIVEDLGKIHGVDPLSKGEKPSVGFVGKAGFDSVTSRFRYFLRNYVLHRGAKKEGMYFRRKALAVMKNDVRLSVRAIVRSTFGAHAKTVGIPIDESRLDYINNIKQSLFTLAPRGDGNYSLRFYETLSLGRIPVLIDTDMHLPLEDSVPYQDIVVRVPHEKLNGISDIVFEYWTSKTEEELVDLQKRAQEVFSSQLYFPVFLRNLFASEKFHKQLAV